MFGGGGQVRVSVSLSGFILFSLAHSITELTTARTVNMSQDLCVALWVRLGLELALVIQFYV